MYICNVSSWFTSRSFHSFRNLPQQKHFYNTSHTLRMGVVAQKRHSEKTGLVLPVPSACSAPPRFGTKILQSHVMKVDRLLSVGVDLAVLCR